MEITFIGYVVIILSIIALIKNENWLLGLTMFFSTFTATKIIDIYSTTTAILPFELPLILWTLKQLIHYIRNPKKSFIELKDNFKKNKLFRAIFIFSIIMIISILNLLLSGIHYEYFDTLHLKNEVIEFSNSNITQLARILGYMLFLMLLTIKLKSKEQIKNILKIFCISTIFALIWGFIQFVMHYLDIQYPNQLFNNNQYYSQQFMQVMQGIKRVSSIATEPSVYALNLLGFFPLIFIFYIFERKTLGIKQKMCFTILIILTFFSVLLTTSSTAYLGLFALFFIFALYELIKNKDNLNKIKIKDFMKKHKIVFLCFVFIIFVIIFALYKFNLINLIREITIDKLSTNSGQERMERETLGFELLRISPILGIGFGSFRTFSMFTNILLNTGIVGLLSYTYLLYVVIKRLCINVKKHEKFSLMLLLSIVGMNIAFLISIPDLIYMYYWMILVCSYNFFHDSEKYDKSNKKELIVVNGRFLTQKMSGVQRYATEVVKELDKTEKDVIVLSPKRDNLNQLELKNVKVLKVGILSGHLWEQLILPLYVMRYKLKYDVKFLNLCNVAPMLIPGHITLHDISFKSNPQHLSFKFILWYRIITFINIRRYKKIFTDSEFSKNEIIKYYHINPDKIVVTYCAAEHLKEIKEDKSILERLELENKEFYFSLGSKSPHKNHAFIEKLAIINPQKTFIVSGNINKVFKNIEDEQKITNLVYTGFITDAEMMALYKNCEAFIFPSTYEGFGIPPLEAITVGCRKVILSDIEVLHEIFEDVGTYVDTKEAKGINLEEIKSIDNSQKIIKKYTWKNVTKKIIDNL